jgi:hypothetical protein
MATPRFTWTDRARPIIQIGIGYAYVDERSALWDQARWDTPGDVWGGAEPAWRDVACDTFTFRCEYGRQRSTDRFVVGQASVVVWNATGWADPNVADEPGTLTMRPGRAIRVGVEHVNLGTRWLFRGFIDALTPVYSPTDVDTVELSCIDALGEVNRAKLLPLPDPLYAGDPVDVRIARLLDAASWPESKTQLQPTGDTLIATTMGGQLADMLGQAADSGGGNVFGDLDGNVVYRARDWQVYMPGTPPDGTIGNVDLTDTPGYTVPGTPQVDGYLDFTKGAVSTPDTSDMSGVVALRLTVRARFDAFPASGFPSVVSKQGPGGTTEREYMLFTSGAVAFGSTTDTTGGAPSLTLSGTLSTGVAHTVGVELSKGSLPATSIVDGVRTARAWGTPPAIPDTTASVLLGGIIAGRTGRLYWAQLERLRARLVFPGVAGNDVSTPSAAPLNVPGDIDIALRLAPPSWAPAVAVGPFAKWGTGTPGSRSWVVFLTATGLQLGVSIDGATGYFVSVALAGVSDGVLGWVRITRVAATGAVTMYTAPDSDTVPSTWSSLGTASTPAGALFASTVPVTLGLPSTGNNPFGGRIARAIVRNGIGGAAVLDVHEDNAANPSSATTFRATTGQTMTVRQTTGVTIVQPQADALVWRFDANDYPGTGTSYVDPRGRTWALAAGAIVPKVPAVPDVVVPGVLADVCPTQWERPFARADLATRVIIGRDQATAQQLDDPEGQTLYGIEPFERTDLLTERDDRITLLGQRILRVRSALSAPRIRSVSLDARTTDAALDLMATVDVFTPSRYRCRLQYPEPRGLVFDAEHFATGVVHELTPSSWSADINLDLAAPYAAAGGRWDGAYWDQATWATPV